MTLSTDWQPALDLLIARAALDSALASELTTDAKACCEQNGINLPDHVKLVISNPDQEVMVKTLPVAQATTFYSIAANRELVCSSTYNSGVEETVTNTTSVEEAEVTTTEAQTAVTTSTAEADIEVGPAYVAVVVVAAT